MRLCRLIVGQVIENSFEDEGAEWKDIHDKVRAAVDKLDQQEPDDEQTKMIRRMK